MVQFVIIAEDGSDADAMNRRMAARPAHFDGARNLKASGNYIMGGAMLDSEGKMRGSVMILQFENEEALNAWLSNEPYVKGKVWQNIQVKPFRVADV